MCEGKLGEERVKEMGEVRGRGVCLRGTRK